MTCPPEEYSVRHITPVFRWVFDSIEHPLNFMPQYHKKPRRFLIKDDHVKCKALGLSFFNSFEGSLERFNELKSFIGERIYSTLGTNVAKGVIYKTDGVNGQLERLGHFTHHTSASTDYKVSFKIIQKL